MAEGNKRTIKRDTSNVDADGAHGHFHDKNRRRKSVASHMAHPLTGETVKERQVFKLNQILLHIFIAWVFTF